jgi:hypothetical protein
MAPGGAVKTSRGVVKAKKEGPKQLFTQECKQWKILKDKILNGEVDFNQAPSVVYRSDESFQEFPLSVFRGAWHRMKTHFGDYVGGTGRGKVKSTPVW